MELALALEQSAEAKNELTTYVKYLIRPEDLQNVPTLPRADATLSASNRLLAIKRMFVICVTVASLRGAAWRTTLKRLVIC